MRDALNAKNTTHIEMAHQANGALQTVCIAYTTIRAWWKTFNMMVLHRAVDGESYKMINT